MSQEDTPSVPDSQFECAMGKQDKGTFRSGRFLIKMMEYLMAITLGYITIIIIAQVVFREFGHPISWSEETARIASLWLTLIGAFLVARQGTHLKVEAFTDFLTGKPELFLKLFVNLVSILCAAILTYYGATLMIALWSSVTPATEIPFPFLFAATIIGSGLMLAYFILETVNLLKDIFSGPETIRK